MATSGDQIWVANGIYFPGKNCEATFQLKNGAALFGGFTGTETTLEGRNWIDNLTILSGDIDGIGGLSGNDAYRVVSAVGITETAILDGLIITGGNNDASTTPEQWGGGLYTQNSNLEIRHVQFNGNSAAAGGGMFSNGGGQPLVLENVFFSNNKATINGGGLHTYNGSNPTLTDVYFSGNSSTYAGGGMTNADSNPSLTNVTFSGNNARQAGGMMNSNGSSPSLTNVTFSDNNAIEGGGMFNNGSNPTLIGVVFSGNRAKGIKQDSSSIPVVPGKGGGMFNYQSAPALTDVTFSGNNASGLDDCCPYVEYPGKGGGMYNDNLSNPTLNNVTFSNNSAEYGGGMYNITESNPTLDKVTFSGNFASGTTVSTRGGGMYNDNSSPMLTNVFFEGNSAAAGGGMYNDYSFPTLKGVTFFHNNAESSGGSASGGGMSNLDSNPLLMDGYFFQNSANLGGGMFNKHSSPTLTGVVFSRNILKESFLGLESGGGMDNYDFCNPILTNVTFSGNRARLGGGMANRLGSKPSLTNVIFTGNIADGDFLFHGKGGGLYNEEGSNPSLTNVTFSGNSTTHDGGGMFSDNSNPILVNTILWGNTPNQIAGATPIITFSDIQGWEDLDNGNINLDPRFADAASGNLRLRFNSPAIDSGDNTAVSIPSDMDGHLRKVEIPEVMDTGNGEKPIVDMGAYEAQLSSSVIYVDQAAPGPVHDGSSWALALTNLQAALAAAHKNDQIWVADGIYTPGWMDNRLATFHLMDDAALFGGFAGTETTLEERNWIDNLTILSGDLDGNDVTMNGVVTDTAKMIGTNTYHVVSAVGITETAILDGLIITGGNNDASTNPAQWGGGLYTQNSNLIIRNVFFEGNLAAAGGGMFSNGGGQPLVLENVFFGNNKATINGGGLHTYNGSNPTLTDVHFSGNNALEKAAGCTIFKAILH